MERHGDGHVDRSNAGGEYFRANKIRDAEPSDTPAYSVDVYRHYGTGGSTRGVGIGCYKGFRHSRSAT